MINFTSNSRSIVEESCGRKKMVGEYGKGELCGIIESLTCSKSSTTLLAARDTEVAKISRGLIKTFQLQFPSLFFEIIKKRLLKDHQVENRRRYKKVEDIETNATSIQGYCTVAVISITPELPIQNIIAELEYSLAVLGSVRCITEEVITSALGVDAMDPINEYKVTGWLGAQEDHHDTIIFQVNCDGKNFKVENFHTFCI